MKVMLPVIDNKKGKNIIADGFHNVSFVCIYDSSLKTLEWMQAKEISRTPGGLNLALIQKGVYSIISKNVTPMVLTMFNRNGINVYMAESFNVSENLELFQANKLKSFNKEQQQIAACRSNSCSSCGVTCN